MEKNYAARHARAAVTRQNLINSSIRLINERGYNNTTIDDICADCGISKGAFYHHFKTKMDIVSKLEAQVSAELYDLLFSECEMDVSEKLQTLLYSLLKGVEESGLEFVRQRSIYNISGEYMKTAGEGSYAVSSRSITRKIICQGIENGELSTDIPVDDVVEAVSTLMSGLISSWTMNNGAFSVTKRAKELGKLVIPGMLGPYMVNKQDKGETV